MPTVPTKPLLIADYTYTLPADRIAVRPVAERDTSRLLVARIPSSIEHHSFRDLPSFLPDRSLLVLNTSKVFRARVVLKKPTGGAAEVLLIAPTAPYPSASECLASREPSTWACLIGGRHIGQGVVLSNAGLSATVLERDGTEGVVRLEWNSYNSLAEPSFATPFDEHVNETLGDVLERIGEMPLPPYLGRDAEEADSVRYQTVYADRQGSAAAPTAGLHFTDDVFASLANKHIAHIDLALHVGLGTFKPIDVEDARDHIMHTESIAIHRKAIEQYVRHAQSDEPWVTVVGTTSLRALESVYWFGVQLLGLGAELLGGEEGASNTFAIEEGASNTFAIEEEATEEFAIEQWAAFTDGPHPTRSESCSAVLAWMDARNLAVLEGTTSIMLAPGCHIATADALVTNFHQPGNSLLLLVAAFCGSDDWKKVYETALTEGYRFLSYGDSSLLINARGRQL